jgi:hypothetical protein
LNAYLLKAYLFHDLNIVYAIGAFITLN